MSKKKINPRRRPLSEADVIKIQDNAVHLAFAIFLTVLKDKFGFSNDDIVRAWREADKLSEEVLRDGLVKLKDLVDMLKEEYKIDLRK
jgi:hypothetical protein